MLQKQGQISLSNQSVFYDIGLEIHYIRKFSVLLLILTAIYIIPHVNAGEAGVVSQCLDCYVKL